MSQLQSNSLASILHRKWQQNRQQPQKQQMMPNNGDSDHSKSSQQNGIDSRFTELELKLNNLIEEYALPQFDQVVEHLRRQQNCRFDQDEIGSIESCNYNHLSHHNVSNNNSSHNKGLLSNSDESVNFELENIYILSPKSDSGNELYTIKNYDSLLKELIHAVAQFANLSDKCSSQHIIEKAVILMLWLMYDSSNLNHLSEHGSSSETNQMNLSRMNFNYSMLEYIFDLNQINTQILDRIRFIARSLFELMNQNFLSQIFFYASMIQKAARDVEAQDHKENSTTNWLELLEQQVAPSKNIRLELIDPFENDSFDFTPLTNDERRLIQNVSFDLDNFPFDHLNSEFILQQLMLENKFPALNKDEDCRMNIQSDQQHVKGSDCSDNVKSEQFVTQSEPQFQSTENAITLLSSELSEFICTYSYTHSEPYYLSHEELFNTILNWIISNNTDQELSRELTNLLGEDSASLITKIVTIYKPNILKSNLVNEQNKSNENVNSARNLNKLERAEKIWKIVSQAQSTGSASLGPNILVQTEKEKSLKKEMRKIEKKYNKELNKMSKEVATADELNSGGQKLSLQDLEKMRERNLTASIKAAFEPRFQENLRPAQPTEQYPFVFDLYQKVKTSAAYIAENKLLLPQGFVKKEFKTNDEFVIPLMLNSEETKEFLTQFPQIKIKDTDTFCQLGFEGFEKLNLIQSTVYPTAYQTDNQNMLICAPTGAGKTNIAMLAILNTIRNYSVDNTPNCIKHDQYKIVYIAPMKALCAEMTATFSRRLKPFGVQVRELTGDMQLTTKEIMQTQMLVVTPEKWDIVTRKSVGDVLLLDLVRLIIIDEVHLLQSDRGHVLETLVARTIRYVEQSQKCIRLVGLSATLPNYVDVAKFLHVDLYKGLFMFDERFRPVPLKKTFIGCKANNRNQLAVDMDEVTYQKAKEILAQDHQVMVFVHSRNATLKLANFLLERSQNTPPGEESVAHCFQADTSRLVGSEKIINRARYRNLSKLLLNGLGVHHAGMPRPERNVVEKLFSAGVIKVLVCTSTLAWGVNLPAHAVIIHGTEYYDPAQGYMVDVDMLDVMQIFGRAGRPQFDTEGEATIITTHAKLAHYLSMLTNQLPIESRFLKRLTDNLNAEIVLGTVSNVGEAVDWLKYTYAFIRMRKNPLEYGLSYLASYDDSIIVEHLYSLIRSAAEQLDRAQMVRYNPDHEGLLDSTHLGRIASHYYIQHETIVHFNESIRTGLDIGGLLDILSRAHEFEQLRCRDEEVSDLDQLRYTCWFPVSGELTNTHTKVNVLMQAAISQAPAECHSLSSDLMYIQQNVSRLTRGLFEYVLKRGWPLLAEQFLSLSLMFEKQFWFFDTPLLQFQTPELPTDVLNKLSDLNRQKILRLYDLRERNPNEIGEQIRHKGYGTVVKRFAHMIPYVEIDATVKPITRTILTVYVNVKPDFNWDDRFHGKTSQKFWIWLTDMHHDHIYHAELGSFTKKQVTRSEVQHYVFTIPLLDAAYLEKQYLIHCIFEHWLGSDNEVIVSCENILFPDKHLPQTSLLDLMPLPVEALQNKLYQSLYRFSHFNPIQTQIFHTLYHTDNNVLLGAPTGSGKTIAAEIGLFRVFNTKPAGAKVVYIAPLKALVRERVDDWKIKIERNIGRRVVELTGDVTPDINTITSADVIVTTPEKWDGVSRGWPSRSYVRQVALIIIDEIHLLGEERGPVLEMIVSRANFICRRTSDQVRIIGLSTAVANAQDLASWLNIKNVGLYNFSSSVRPVPIEVHVSGFSGKHYCPRMALMNKPAFRAIKKFSPEKPVIIFVSSRRQTRLTALELISLIASDDHSNALKYLRLNQEELINTLSMISDAHLRHTINFGIGMHHAGLREGDRKLVEELFANQKIQILITTATLAWGVNLPAHAVIIKGTEFFDGKKGRYVDFPITDVLQMIGRAGRPQFDDSAVAVLFVHDIKKEYYKKFLYEPFPVESHMLEVFADHLNAEVVAGTVQSKHEAMEYLSSTYLYRRIVKNPSYYGVDLSEIGDQEMIVCNETQVTQLAVQYLSAFIDQCVQTLEEDYCIRCITSNENLEDFATDHTAQQRLVATPLGKISSFYYLSHQTVRQFQDSLGVFVGDSELTHLSSTEVLDLLTQATEYAPLPVRHNEELLNEQLARQCPIKLSRRSMDSPHTKANLLIQAHCSRLPLPIVDYYTDLKSVLDQAIRIMQAMVDIAALNGSLPSTLNIIQLQQCILQASWQQTNQLVMLLETKEHSSNNNSEQYMENELNDATQYYDSRRHSNDSLVADLERIPQDFALIPYLLHLVHNNAHNPSQELFNLLSPYHIHRSIVNRLCKSLLQLPLIQLEHIYLSENSVNRDECSSQSNRMAINSTEIFKSAREISWLSLKSDTDYLLECRFRRKQFSDGKSSFGRRSKNTKAFCPRYHKPKFESWYLVLGLPERSELVSMCRVPNIHSLYSSFVTLQFRTLSVTKTAASTEQRHMYMLYLLSDCYIGLDQQYALPLAIT